MNYTAADPGNGIETPSKASYLFWQDGMAGMEATDKSVGPAIGLKVNAGDKIDIETWVRYEQKEVYTNNMTLAVLSQALGSAFAYRAGFEAMTVTQTTNAISAALTDGGFLNMNPDDLRPYAYLNYILFDENNVLIDAGFQRVTEEAGFQPGGEGLPNNRSHTRLAFDEPIQINQAGSIYIWVSNESEDTRVWFDDLRVSHSTSFVVQATDYGVWGDVLREQKSEDKAYKFGYQGQFAERDEQTGWSHFELREYDAIIGRWTTMDPNMQYYSPYLSMGNNPVSRMDPDGGLDEYNMINGEKVWVSNKGGSDVEYINYYETWIQVLGTALLLAYIQEHQLKHLQMRVSNCLVEFHWCGAMKVSLLTTSEQLIRPTQPLVNSPRQVVMLRVIT
jgi:RHS repeat-associated protein